MLNLPQNRLLPTLLVVDEGIQRRLNGEDKINYRQRTAQYLQKQGGDLVLEGPGTEEGRLFDLSLLQVAEGVDAKILLVARYKSVSSVETVLSPSSA